MAYVEARLGRGVHRGIGEFHLFDEVGALLDRYPGLAAELSFRARDVVPADRLDVAWRRVLLRHAERFIIGTDAYVSRRRDGYGARVEAHRRWLAQLPGDVARAIAYGNAARGFGPSN